VKIADLGSCFAAAGVDTGRLSFEMQTLSYRAPEAGTFRVMLSFVMHGGWPHNLPGDMPPFAAGSLVNISNRPN